jgi:hypothetical protein
MNKTLVLGAIALTVFAASTAHADDRYRRDAPRYDRNHNVGYTDRGHRHSDWVAPVVGGLILGVIISEASRPAAPVVIYAPPPAVSYTTPEQIAYQRGVEERLRQEQIERERAAYQCGLTGNC